MTATSTHFRVDRWLMGRIRRLPWRLGGIISVFAGVTLLLHLFAQVNFLPLDIAKTRWTEQSVRKYTWLPTADYDIVMAYFDEGNETMADAIRQVTDRLPLFTRHRVIIYTKNGEHSGDAMNGLLAFADEVVWLPNVGREGDTYLTHITRHYDSALTNLAKYTIFMQPHLAWDWIMLPRLETLSPKTGFMSLGPYNTQTCGVDAQGNEFPRMADIYSAFTEELCPPVPVLSTWAGQFVVSRKRILQNKRETYQKLLDLFHAPPDHWIWKEGWWNNEPANPTLGHALERTWPVIFGCTDVALAEGCGEGSGMGCQCLD